MGRELRRTSIAFMYFIVCIVTNRGKGERGGGGGRGEGEREDSWIQDESSEL